ncbi:DNA methyltransferase [Mycobacterium phage WillSterrel]|uniref:Cytosine-specific methyltransferase n=1 Tax=Mycobacterium phage WillSterrel TaxID=1897769 RepID=A0A1C9M029_9CAUD|nr:DNA methyltransferase [Mycobacterium phage WillSterrel]AOQ28524.1 DNA methylase [Mycobacterium phage WillSterrel]AYQ99586.1 DNA methylase [Mycobacterium phage IrishSherpFalk]
MRIGSICSGAAGLDLAVEQVFGAHTVWHCEVDTAASKVLAHRYPDIPNHGDITAIDWDTVEPVDILCGGYPCQPFSHAGQRKGTNDERHIWPYVREAIRRVRPRYTVLENVAGHRSLGFDRVLGDLAEDGLHVRWTSIRASDIGAPHQRDRLFVVVTDPRDGDVAEWARPSRREGGERTPIRGVLGSGRQDDRGIDLLPTPTTQDGSNCGGPSQFNRNSLPLNAVVTLLPTPQGSDGYGGKVAHPDSRRAAGHSVNLSEVAMGDLLPTPSASDGIGGGPNDPVARISNGHQVQLIDLGMRSDVWGRYTEAIQRWERATRPAPPCTEPSPRGKYGARLNPAFPEWMMGWPTGWVTQVPGISRNDQLRIIGNGVVPQQAAAALRWLLSVEVAA